MNQSPPHRAQTFQLGLKLGFVILLGVGYLTMAWQSVDATADEAVPVKNLVEHWAYITPRRSPLPQITPKLAAADSDSRCTVERDNRLRE